MPRHDHASKFLRGRLSGGLGHRAAGTAAWLRWQRRVADLAFNCLLWHSIPAMYYGIEGLDLAALVIADGEDDDRDEPGAGCS